MRPQAALPLSQLQLLLLDLLSPVRPLAQASIDVLAPPDWATLLDLAGQYRLGPLLHWQLARAHASLQLPSDVAAQLAGSHKRSTLRNLSLQRELLLLHRVLTQAGIPYVALKGAYLANHAYPQAALRPMRDLDILVPRALVLQAWQTLLDAGWLRIDLYQGTPDAAMLQNKHLPPLRSASGLAIVELHARLFDQNPDAPEPADLSESPAFWARRIKAAVAGQSLTFESPTDLLLHLIVHAVHEHQFNNGPLLLSDLAFLINTQPIDWPLFWQLAQKQGQTRGCLLALRLTQRYWDVPRISWTSELPQAAPAALEAALDMAAALMLRDLKASSYVNLHIELARSGSAGGKIQLVLRKLFPPRSRMAAAYPVTQHDWRLHFWYPVEWWRLLTLWLAAFWRSRGHSQVQQEVRQLVRLKQWIDQVET
jgi:hypothetical protein